MRPLTPERLPLTAAPADRGDRSAAPIRRHGIAARAAAPGLPVNTAAPATAPRTGAANRTHVWRAPSKVDLVNLKAGKAPGNG
ncbi:hypothetical protein SAMN05428954_3861 [Streptomyces sp. 2112.3]|nr:hypothetical protein SAMN05428954_3861 [Streptomyces sp. 2112.3]